MDAGAFRKAEGRLWTALGAPAPTERDVHLDALGSAVRVLEVGDGPPLLFLHGGPNAGSTWAPLVAHLAAFRCLVVDRPGCGLSPPARKEPPGGVRVLMATLVAELLRALEPRPVGVVASSFGSYAVLAHALAHPGEALPTVHMGCPALVPGSKTPLRFLLTSLPGIGRLLRLLEPPGIETARRTFRQIGHGASIEAGVVPDEVFRWYAALLSATRTRRNDLALFGRIRPRDRLGEEELRTLTAPASLFWGGADSFGGAAVGEALAAILSAGPVEMVPEGGHLPWLDAPEAAARHVRAFMQEHVARHPHPPPTE